MRGAFMTETEMATVKKRHRNDGGVSWDATVRVRGYPTQCKSFRTRLEPTIGRRERKRRRTGVLSRLART